MSEQHVILRLIRDCDIYFEDFLISKEMLLRKYREFFAEAISAKERVSYVTLHTGSICFDVIAYIIAALICI